MEIPAILRDHLPIEHHGNASITARTIQKHQDFQPTWLVHKDYEHKSSFSHVGMVSIYSSLINLILRISAKLITEYVHQLIRFCYHIFSMKLITVLTQLTHRMEESSCSQLAMEQDMDVMVSCLFCFRSGRQRHKLSNWWSQLTFHFRWFLEWMGFQRASSSCVQLST